jgi:predicted nuclease of predicted toxin-antitoxin system
VQARLLLDESLSERMLPALAEDFPDSCHLRSINASGATDRSIWTLAETAGFVLVTRDEDFVNLSVLRGAPPKVIWLNIGSAHDVVIVALLKAHAADIERFAAHDEQNFLALGFYRSLAPR